MVSALMHTSEQWANEREVMGFLVRDLDSGAVVHHELMPSGGVDSSRLAHRSSRRVEALERMFRYPRFEVESGLYSSPEAFFRANPDVPEPEEHE